VWDDLIYRLVEHGQLALGEDGSVHTVATRDRDFTTTRARRRRRPPTSDTFQTPSERTSA
jgi:hypothetical protein